MGVTSLTAEEIFIGAGEVYVDDVTVGATLDNNVFRVVQEKGAPDLNGTPGPIVGIDYIDSETAELEVTLPQIGSDKLLLSIPGAVSVVGDAIGVASGASTDLASPSTIGATSIVVTSATGIANGDMLQIGAAGSREFRKVTDISGAPTLVLNGALTKAHSAADPVIEVTATTLAADAPISSTNIKLTSVTGLAVGDFLRFGNPAQYEVRQLTFVGTAGAGGTGVSFAFPTQHFHESGVAAMEQSSLGSTVIKSGAGTSRRIPSSAYHKWELVVEGLDGRFRRFRLLKAIMTDNPEYEASDDPEAPLAPRLTLQARWEPDVNGNVESPWEIEIVEPAA